MQLPDFLLPKRVQERLRNLTSADAMELRSLQRPDLHESVTANLSWLLLLYCIGLEMPHWLNVLRTLSPIVWELQFWMDHLFGINSTMGTIIGFFAAQMLISAVCAVGLVWLSVAASELAFTASLLAAPAMGFVLGLTLSLANPQLVGALQIAMGLGAALAFWHAQMAKHAAVAVAAMGAWIVWKFSLGLFTLGLDFKLALYGFALPVLLLVRLNRMLLDMLKMYLQSEEDQYMLPVLVMATLNFYFATCMLAVIWNVFRKTRATATPQPPAAPT